MSVKEEIEKIKIAEEKASSILTEAKKEAERIIQEAKILSLKIVEQAIEIAKKEGALLKEKKLQEVQQQAKGIIQQAEEFSLKLKKDKEGLKEEAVKFLLDKIRI